MSASAQFKSALATCFMVRHECSTVPASKCGHHAHACDQIEDVVKRLLLQVRLLLLRLLEFFRPQLVNLHRHVEIKIGQARVAC